MTTVAVPSEEKAGERRGFLALDGLRGVAALAIVLRHGMPASTAILPRSYLAVDLFFALSGFILFHVYVPRFAAGLRPRTFLLQRVIRLYPLYFAGTAAFVALVLAGALIGSGAHPPLDAIVASAALNILFLPVPPVAAFYGSSAFPFNYPAWSLFWEMAINIAFAGMVTWLTPGRLFRLVALGAVLLIGSGWHFGGLDSGSTHATFFGGGGRVVYAFFVGGLVHRAWTSGRYRWHLPFPLASLLLLASFSPHLSGWTGTCYDVTVALIAYPLLLLGTAGALTSMRVGRLCHVLGASSYAVYATHVAIIEVARMVSPHLFHRPYETLPNGFAVLVCLSAVVVALILNRYYDQPLRALLGRKLVKSSPPQPPDVDLPCSVNDADDGRREHDTGDPRRE